MRLPIKLSILFATCALAGCGGGSTPASQPVVVTPPLVVVTPPPPPVAALSLFAGTVVGGKGSADGTGAAAKFNGPQGVAVDSAGNVYVADVFNDTIRKMTPAGVVTTLAGTVGVVGSADGTGAAAKFNQPVAVAVDSAGNVYVADRVNDTIRKITPFGVVSTLAGTAGVIGSADGIGAAARFNLPTGIATDNNGNVYVVDRVNQTIRKITPGGLVSTLAGKVGVHGSSDGVGSAALFDGPNGIVSDSAGNLYVSDANTNIIRKITPAGLVSTLAGTPGVKGSADGIGAAASFNNPLYLAIDSSGNLYITEVNNTIRKLTPAGVVTTLAGQAGVAGSADGSGIAVSFNLPEGIAADSVGNLYVADLNGNLIRKITPAGVTTTVAGAASNPGSSDGVGASARFNTPSGIAADSAGNLYVSDKFNATVRKITASGVVTTLAGTVGKRGSVDGIGATAGFDIPVGIAVDKLGTVYIADNYTLRKMTPDGTVSTLAGLAGSSGIVDGTGSSARFNFLGGIVIDNAGNFIVTDQANHTLRKITPAGVVTTLAGKAGVAGGADGVGEAANFNWPSSVAMDSEGNFYVTDQYGNTVRKVTANGVVTTIAGTSGTTGHADGTGAAASFNSLNSIAISNAGNIYVVDQGNNLIRKITPAGVVTTVVGTLAAGFVSGPLPGGLGNTRHIVFVGTSLYITTENGVAVVTNMP